MIVEIRFKESLLDIENVWIVWVRDKNKKAYKIFKSKPTEKKVRNLKNKLIRGIVK